MERGYFVPRKQKLKNTPKLYFNVTELDIAHTIAML